MKLFSFINDKKVHLAPTKIIKAEEFETLLTARSLLEQTKKDAIEYKKKVVKECELLKEQAQKEGFQQGLKEWARQIAYLEEEIKNTHDQVEKSMVSAVLLAAKKIVGREIEQNEKTIVDIISNSLKSVSEHKIITLYVSKEDLEVIEKNKKELEKMFGRLESLSIQEREDIKPRGCIIETEVGIVNAQNDEKWRALENAFQSLMNKEIETNQRQ